MVFSNPGTFQDAVKNGTYEQWQRIVTDPRFQQQQLRRGAKQWQATAAAAGDQDDLSLPAKTKKLKKDWSMTMGSGGKVGPDQYPAIFSAYTQANCDSATQPDFAVFNTAVAGVTSGTATQTASFTGPPTPSGDVVITNGNDSITLTATSGTQSTQCSNTGTNHTGSFHAINTNTTDASNLAALINAANCGAFVGVSATYTSGISFTVNATTPGPGGNNITLTGSLSAFSWGGASLAGGGQPSIMAFDNLYSSCSGTSPLVYFQYDTNGGTASTSVAMYDDGVQMAFIQAVGGVANLAILKSARNTRGSNASLVTLNATNGNLVAASAYRTCVAPCMTEIALSGSPTVTYSAPYYDFGSDSIYVGDDSGVLHKFTNIFVSGTPDEITGGGTSSGWPQNISSVATDGTDPLTSPIFDSTSGNVLVFDSGIVSTAGAKLVRIPSAGGIINIVVSAELGYGGGYGFSDGPLVDSTAARVYGFTNDNIGNTGAAVYQLTTTFSSGSSGSSETVGAFNQTSTLHAYDGSFDNIYYNSNNGSSPTGNLYVCGRAAASALPTLYQIPIMSNTMQTPNRGPALATASTDCSPVAEFFNTTSGVDWLFLSVEASAVTGSPINCTGGAGCIMNFNVTTGATLTTSKATSATSKEASGTSGLVVDNALTTTGSTGYSNVYFSPLADQACGGNGSYGSYGTGGCSIQASQAAP